MVRIIVPDSQLSLAIGKEGQNARLAAKLTNWRIDIKGYEKYKSDILNKEIDVEFDDEQEFVDNNFII